MGNVLEKAKQEQVIALGRLGWSLRRIEEATGVRRETAGGYLRSAGIRLRAPGGWGRKPPSKAATSATTGPPGEEGAKPANEVITGFLPEVTLPERSVKRPSGASEPYRELIELELSRGRNAMGIWQLCRDRHSCIMRSPFLCGASDHSTSEALSNQPQSSTPLFRNCA